MIDRETEVRKFWIYIESLLTLEGSGADEKWLPDMLANEIDDNRYLEPLILREAERDPKLKALLERADAISDTIPLSEKGKAAFIAKMQAEGRGAEALGWIEHGPSFMVGQAFNKILAANPNALDEMLGD